jgi:uncharacterized repeat protein (TIGR01451 family)
MVNLKVNLSAFMVLLPLLLTGLAVTSTPLNAAGQTVTLNQGQSATMHASSVNGVAFQWLKNQQFIPEATRASYVASTSGVYQVMSTNATDCMSELSDPVTVIVSSNGSDPVVADMMVGITSTVTTANMDAPYNYTITVKNNGPSTATAVNMQNNLPEQVQFQQFNTPYTGTVDYNTVNKKVTWTLEQLTSGQSTALNFSVKAIKPGTISNTATVSALQTDPNLDNNTATNIITMAGLTIPNELTVINRWGSTVYQKKGYKNEWNGSGLNEGTYFYLLRVQNPIGKWDVYKGYITLLRTVVK